MSFEACLDRALAEKKITGNRRDLAVERYRNLYNDYVETLGPDAAAQKAADDATRFFEIEIAEAKRRKVMQIAKTAEILQHFKSYKGKNFGKAAQALIEYDPRAPFNNYVALQNRVHGQLGAMLSGFIEKYKPSEVLGALRQNKAGLDDIVRAIFGETTDGQSAAFAKAWKETTTFAMKRFRQGGGSIMDLEGWNLPQHQDAVALKKIGADQWIEDHLEWMDWNKVRTEEDARIAPEDRRKFLREAYNTLLTDGANKSQTGGGGRRALGNQLDKHRVLHFKDANAWLAMHNKYGEGSVFDTMVGHIDYMAHQIAMLETFGPNPAAMRENIWALARADAADKDIGGAKTEFASEKVKEDLDFFDAMFDTINRQTAMRPENRIGQFFGGTRNLLATALLSSSTLAAVPGDLVNMRFVAGMNGMKEAKLVRRYLANINPANPADRRLAARIGFINENAVGVAFSQRRFADIEGIKGGWTRAVSDVAFRLTLMSPHTQMARYAFNTEFLGLLTDNAGKAFDTLPFRSTLEKHGITAKEWETYSALPERDFDGATFRHPDDLTDYRLGDKIMSMIVDEGRRAVPDSTIRATALFKDKTRPGTFGGEVLRSTAMFKNFPMSVYYLIVRDGLAQASTQGKAAYLARYVLYMTLAGMVAQQAYELKSGRDVQNYFDFDNPTHTATLWGQALLRGGGLGIYGDFLFGDVNRFGGGLSDTIAGPLMQFFNDTRNLTVGNGLQVLANEDPKFFAELTEYVSRYTPKPWYARVAMDRMIFEQLTQMADPRAREKLRRYEQEAAKRGQSFWWKPGQFTPSRSPVIASSRPN